MQQPAVCHLPNEDVEVLNSEYGKNVIKLLRIRRDGKKHCIKEVEACVHLRLDSVNEYLHGDNSAVIPTDTMKNIVLALAKCKGIQTVEQFALDICNHFISSYCHVVYVKTYVQEVPWRRLEKNGIPHVHSFICVPEGIRFCEAEQCRNGCPLVISGIKELKLKKTTQSGFQGFHRDKYTTIPDRTDRVLSAELFCKWSYGECQDIDFDCVWNTVHECVLEAFSGPPDCGEYSPSHQKTVNNIQMLTLARVPQIQEIEITLNNIYYDVIDLQKFGLTNDKEVLIPVDIPYASYTCTLGRKKCLREQA
ncbi:uricase-like [Mauremys reevesii]|uniref:uricase-like n=1 Tax=Mauremys reevesii TaxID=260615 RepID=UPI00193EDCFE|nr:uricase-like [Mauremys reevesii]